MSWGGVPGRRKRRKQKLSFSPLFNYLLKLGLCCRVRSSSGPDLPERRGQALEHGPQRLEVARLVPERRGERRQAGRANRLLRRGVVREQVAEPLCSLAAAFGRRRGVGERVREGGDGGVGVEGCCSLLRRSFEWVFSNFSLTVLVEIDGRSNGLSRLLLPRFSRAYCTHRARPRRPSRLPVG